LAFFLPQNPTFLWRKLVFRVAKVFATRFCGKSYGRFYSPPLLPQGFVAKATLFKACAIFAVPSYLTYTEKAESSRLRLQSIAFSVFQRAVWLPTIYRKG
jgi:hypothetical protein